MAGEARVCPRCGEHFYLPFRQGHALGMIRTAGSRSAGLRTVSVRVNDVIVHQCQQRVDAVTGVRAWRPARTVGADPR
jgi:hypothetical protein